MTLINIIKTALKGLTSNKLRSMLTTLGIIIGVASVIIMLAIGNGAKKEVEESFRFLGADAISINQKQQFEDGQYQTIGEILSYHDGLYMKDQVELVERVEMNVSGNAKIRFGRNVIDIGVSGVTADVINILILKGAVQPIGTPEGTKLDQTLFIAEGRFFTEAEVLAQAKVCVLGSKTAEDLFKGDNPIGETVWVNRDKCEVIGVFNELESTNPDEKYSTNPNQAFYLPISTIINMLYDQEPSVYITARVTDQTKIKIAKQQITNYLREKHHVEKDIDGNYIDDFELTTLDDIIGAEKEAANTFSTLLIGMASVSLIVGGIGIMNVMLVSVTERTKEIGVRLAIGAREIDIILQFLFESIFISFGGGVLGIAIGIIAIPLSSNLNNGVAILDPASIPLAFGISLSIGMIFGLYPAARASKLLPVDALRYE
jgi:putative ABC transport system permease protein